jgi:hypothetical protein
MRLTVRIRRVFAGTELTAHTATVTVADLIALDVADLVTHVVTVIVADDATACHPHPGGLGNPDSGVLNALSGSTSERSG